MFKIRNFIWLILFVVFIFLLGWWQNNKIKIIWQSEPGDNEIMNWQHNSVDVLQNIVTEVESSVMPMVEVLKTPPPLKTDLKNKTNELVDSKIIFYTNQARLQYQLPPLKENNLLQQAAQNKLSDMVKNQYFDHVSPQGVSARDVIDSVGYKFIAIGENLALGGYSDEADLVNAWLASPGHRENILSKNYTEIGVAVVYTEFAGEMTWIAVQEFGRPASDCPAVNEMLKNQIEQEKISLQAKENELETKLTALNVNRPAANATRQQIDDYNRLVEEYNNLVAIYKQQAENLKQQIQIYNQQVEQFNTCLKNINY